MGKRYGAVRFMAGMSAAALLAAGLSAVPANARSFDWNAEGLAWKAGTGLNGDPAVYRLFNYVNGQHLYSTDWDEVTKLSALGWRYEGVAFYGVKNGGQPVWRLYNPADGQHLLTLNAAEKDLLSSPSGGWNVDGIAFNTDASGPVDVLRVYNPGTHEHLWTVSPQEYETLTGVQAPGGSGSKPDTNQNLQQQIEQAKKTVADAQAKFDQLKQDVDTAKNVLDAAKQKVQDAQAKVDALQKLLDNASSATALDYFRARGASTAVRILTDSAANPFVGTVKIGDPNSASNIDNMIRAVQFIQECNRLRAQEGLPALEVSDSLMATSISAADYNRYDPKAKYDVHASAAYYNIGENMAWNYSDPFDGWYTAEKAEYEAGNTNFGSVGHYLNIVDRDYSRTGFGWTADRTAIQDFDAGTFVDGTDLDYGRLMTPEAYLQDLQAYKDSQAGSSQGGDAQTEAQLQAAKQALADAQTALKDAENKYQAALSAQEAAGKALEDAKNVLAELEKKA